MTRQIALALDFAQKRTLHDLVEAGVRVYYYSTGEELGLDTPVHEFMSAAKNFGNQWYRHQVRTKTREAMRARAAKGYLTGGRVLGYTTATTDGVAKRVVDPEQAEIVRRVFAMCAEGKGIHRIAKTLNAEGVPNPTGQDCITGKKASASMWSSTGVRESCIASCTAAWSRTARLAGRIAAASR